MGNRAEELLLQGKTVLFAFEEAIGFVNRALAVHKRILVEHHPFLGDARVILAQNYSGLGDLAAAEQELRRALEIYRQAVGDEHPSVANCLYELGNLIWRQQRLVEAEPLFERSLAIRERLLEADHPLIAESLRGLAEVRARQGETGEAEQLFGQALAIWEEHPKNPSTVEVPGSYASFLRSVGRVEDAEEIDARALARAGMQ